MYNSEWMSPSSIGGSITNFLRRGDNPLLSYTLREGAKRQWRLLCTDRSGTEKRSDFDKKMSAELTKITRQVSASIDLNRKLRPTQGLWFGNFFVEDFFSIIAESFVYFLDKVDYNVAGCFRDTR